MGLHCRRVGAGAIAKERLAEAKYKERGTVSAEAQLGQMSKQLGMFKTHLEEFASKHKREIRKDPEFRVQFQDTCATLGWIVCPLERILVGDGRCGSFLLRAGNPDDWSVCGSEAQEWRSANSGGTTPHALKGRGRLAQDVGQDDSIRAMEKLKALGTGFASSPWGVPSAFSGLQPSSRRIPLWCGSWRGRTATWLSDSKARLKWEAKLWNTCCRKGRPCGPRWPLLPGDYSPGGQRSLPLTLGVQQGAQQQAGRRPRRCWWIKPEQ